MKNTLANLIRITFIFCVDKEFKCYDSDKCFTLPNIKRSNFSFAKTGPWTKEEDEHVIELVQKYGPKRWTLIAKHLKGRIGKQCRERWHNHLNPDIKKTSWTEEEDRIIYNAHKQWGNQVTMLLLNT